MIQTLDSPESPAKIEAQANGAVGRESRVALRRDLFNLGLVALGFVAVLLIVSPVRSFSTNDDWAYAQSVGDLLRGEYRPHGWAQASALGHVAWGAAFAAIFGQSF